MLDGVIQERLCQPHPDFLSLLPEIERTGRLPPVVPNGFVGYAHRPGDLADEVSEAGSQLDDLVGVEGLPLAGTDLRPGSATRARGACSSRVPEPSNGFRSCSARVHASSPRPREHPAARHPGRVIEKDTSSGARPNFCWIFVI